MNIADLITSQALLRPAAPAIIEGDRTLTYRELDLLTDRVAAGIGSLSLGDGERIGLCLKDRSEFLACFFAIAKVGAVALILDWRTAPHARAQFAKGFGAALVVRERDMPDVPGIPCLARSLAPTFGSYQWARYHLPPICPPLYTRWPAARPLSFIRPYLRVSDYNPLLRNRYRRLAELRTGLDEPLPPNAHRAFACAVGARSHADC